ncbi:contactin [Plakobranchus ocellatus]|uniref:Contactin n=1 Tax=Plakobranchus ocellatus TaxID=259542 RepID=A0AAV3Z1L4_9GAST|nr:contactin [Plakobranchus ocellatus]
MGNENTFTTTVGADNFYLEYEVKIAAFNNNGTGPNSTVHTIMSAEDGCAYIVKVMCVCILLRGVGGTVDSESAPKSAGTLLLRVRAPSPAPWPDGGP